jgi:hypothetical protein
MGKKIIKLDNEVTAFLDKQNHPFRKEIEYLRNCILSVSNNLTENIKWNGPNYGIKGNDRITMRINPPKQIQLVFHTGAKVKNEPTEKILNDDFGILTWRDNHRALVTFNSMEDIEKCELNLKVIIEKWIAL